MEKYAKLLKGLEMCAGPECCKDGCPYYGESNGVVTCRARLLDDASVAINNEQALRESAEEGHKDACEQVERLKEDASYLGAAFKSACTERDKLRGDNEELRKECDMMATRCTVLQNEINALVLKMGGKHDGKTDRPSVDDKELMAEVCKMICEAKYQEAARTPWRRSWRAAPSVEAVAVSEATYTPKQMDKLLGLS